MSRPSLLLAPVTELRALIDKKELSPVELVDLSLARIEELNPGVNAFIQVLADEARESARGSEDRIRRGEGRPLEGIPIAIKDVVMVAGTSFRLGSAAMPDTAIPMESEQVSRLRQAGAVIAGKTHMPEFGSTAASEGKLYGATFNPWNLNHTSGGSSSGSAAAVAAGMIPAAHGADGGGSLRIPASWCGLFTMKPSRGRVSPAPLTDILHNTVYGFLTRTVRDCALLMDQVSGYVLGDTDWAPPPSRPFVEECDRPPGRLRIGVSLKPPIDVVVEESCLSTTRQAAQLCESLGHDVEEHELAWSFGSPLLGDGFWDMWAGIFGFVVKLLMGYGLDPDHLEPHNRELWKRSAEITATDYLGFVSALQDGLLPILNSWKTYDVVLTPATAAPAPRIGELWNGADSDPMAVFYNCLRVVPFSPLFNFTGQPAACLPLGSQEDLPIGVQAVGRPGDESTLFRLSAQIEEAHQWSGRQPEVIAR